MRDKPKSGMSKKPKKREKHDDAKQDKTMVKKMVKGACLK
jgi:hypothetical protein